MSARTCLNCKHEPDWSEPTKGEYARQYGMCKWSQPIPAMPQTHTLYIKGVTRFVKDNSGVMTQCKTWEAKC